MKVQGEICVVFLWLHRGKKAGHLFLTVKSATAFPNAIVLPQYKRCCLISIRIKVVVYLYHLEIEIIIHIQKVK